MDVNVNVAMNSLIIDGVSTLSCCFFREGMEVFVFVSDVMYLIRLIFVAASPMEGKLLGDRDALDFVRPF